MACPNLVITTDASCETHWHAWIPSASGHFYNCSRTRRGKLGGKSFLPAAWQRVKSSLPVLLWKEITSPASWTMCLPQARTSCKLRNNTVSLRAWQSMSSSSGDGGHFADSRIAALDSVHCECTVEQVIDDPCTQNAKTTSEIVKNIHRSAFERIVELISDVVPSRHGEEHRGRQDDFAGANLRAHQEQIRCLPQDGGDTRMQPHLLPRSGTIEMDSRSTGPSAHRLALPVALFGRADWREIAVSVRLRCWHSLGAPLCSSSCWAKGSWHRSVSEGVRIENDMFESRGQLDRCVGKAWHVRRPEPPPSTGESVSRSITTRTSRNTTQIPICWWVHAFQGRTYAWDVLGWPAVRWHASWLRCWS